MKVKQLEIFDKMPKVENKAIFTLSKGGRYAFIDTEGQLKERKHHTLVIHLDEDTHTKACAIILSGYVLKFQSIDSKIRGVPLGMYISISNLLKKKGIMFNKKTCEIILRTNRKNPTAI